MNFILGQNGKWILKKLCIFYKKRHEWSLSCLFASHNIS